LAPTITHHAVGAYLLTIRIRNAKLRRELQNISSRNKEAVNMLWISNVDPRGEVLMSLIIGIYEEDLT
jgi:hypothetical protein